MQRLYSKPLANINTINISIVGMNGSGKSAVVVKYLTRRFIVEYAPYLSDSYTKTDSVDGQELTINVQDTSDSEEIDLDDIIKWSQAIIILFSITSRRSFYRAQELIEACKQLCDMSGSKIDSNVLQRLSTSVHSAHHMSSNPISNSIGPPSTPIPGLSPGNTGSLRRSALYTINTAKPPVLILVANKADLERFRLVQKNEAESFATAHGIPYFEITVTENYAKVQTIFHTAARLCLQNRSTKVRNPSSGANSAPRNLLSNVNLTASNTGSVLTSLAVSPGLLLQKKSTSQGEGITASNMILPPPPTTTTTINTTTTTTIGTANTLNVNFSPSSINSRSSESELTNLSSNNNTTNLKLAQNLSTSQVSMVTTTTAPTSAELRSSSPGWLANLHNPITTRASILSSIPTNFTLINASSSSGLTSRKSQTNLNKMSNTQGNEHPKSTNVALTKSGSGRFQPSSPITSNASAPTLVVRGASSATALTNDDVQSVIVSSSHSAAQIPPAPPPVPTAPQKKSSMGFKFFSKKK